MGFKRGKDTSVKRGKITVKVVHDPDGEPCISLHIRHQALPSLINLTDIEVLRDLCNELLEANS